MKSIKEKAKDYVSGFHPSIQRMCNESYIDGANYVLEEIEKLVKFNRWAAQDLYELIEQLKK